MDVSTTRRHCSPELEKRLDQPISLLNHGFIRLVDYMGNDSAIVQAARISYGKGTRKRNEDERLIRYLMRHHHTSPFEMCELKLHIKMPIFVARQWVRHRMASVNEYSARYSVLDREFYVPAPNDLSTQSTTNQQSRDQSKRFNTDDAAYILECIKRDSLQCYESYEDMLNGNEETSRPALARELARMNLPVNFYTQCYWKIDLHNLLHFIALRNDKHAQYEIRIYAEAIQNLVREWVPLTAKAFEDYVMNGEKLSAQAVELLSRHLQGKKLSYEKSNMSKGEWRDFNLFLDKLAKKEDKEEKIGDSVLSSDLASKAGLKSGHVLTN